MTGTLAGDGRAAGRIGRSARLELTFAARDRRTVLARGYAEPPLRVGRCLHDGPQAHLILASSAPGIFGGDHFVQRVRVEPGAAVRLSSQSALQLHPATDGAPAIIDAEYDVGAGSALVCAWEPLIPFAGSALEQRITVRLAATGRLVWSDALMRGRDGSGECWRFVLVDHELRVRRDGATVYLERYRLEPQGTARDDTWWSGQEHAFFGTALAVGIEDAPAQARAIHDLLAGEPDVSGAAEWLDERTVLVRTAARHGAPFHRLRRAVHDALARAVA